MRLRPAGRRLRPHRGCASPPEPRTRSTSSAEEPNLQVDQPTFLLSERRRITEPMIATQQMGEPYSAKRGQENAGHVAFCEMNRSSTTVTLSNVTAVNVRAPAPLFARQPSFLPSLTARAMARNATSQAAQIAVYIQGLGLRSMTLR